MTKVKDIEKILVIGSGPIVIGQAAEFDYSGSQACLALKEEGYSVILVNSNPATIMTDRQMADRVYIEPINLEYFKKIIDKERPDALLASLGGQTGLNMAMELKQAGILDQCHIQVLGTSLDSIRQAEDREAFRSLMQDIGEPVVESEIVHSLDEAFDFAQEIGYPIIVRPAYTLAGSGGGICKNQEELKEIVTGGLEQSPVHQCLLERSIAGYQEIEYEVIRDQSDEVIIVCGMENFDPVGVHTGDSIVYTPIQSLNEQKLEQLESVSKKIIRALDIVGGCNVQLAQDPHSDKYYIIEVNPRVSRSSALASKATGFPIARVTAQLAVGFCLSELIQASTGKSFASYDHHHLDAVVCKMPRFPFDKFPHLDHQLGTQMKSTGEVMGVGQHLEEASLKAIRSLELKLSHPDWSILVDASQEELVDHMTQPTDLRYLALCESLRRGQRIEDLEQLTHIQPVFLESLARIVEMEEHLEEDQSLASLKAAKQVGFSDETIGKIWGKTSKDIATMRQEHQVLPHYLQIQSWSNLADHSQAYFYSSYSGNDQNIVSNLEKVVVLGSGPIRIGQGVEFDYATVHAVEAIQDMGYEAIVINSNPETVSTDFLISDKLYVDPLCEESVLDILSVESHMKGVLLQFGGQTAINLASELSQHGVKILGSSLEAMNQVEDRQSFENLLQHLAIPHSQGQTALTVEEALSIPEQIEGYPVLVRPSYVLGGRGMQIVDNEENLAAYAQDALKEVFDDHPILIDHYLEGIEVEVDAVFDGQDILIQGIMEHVERAGVHSGDSMSIYPPQQLSQEVCEKITHYTQQIAEEAGLVGLVNIQFIVRDEEVYMIEVNPRASRSLPFISKIRNIPLAQVACQACLGKSIQEQGYPTGLLPALDGVYVKAPVFSFHKLKGIDPSLGPEMKSTGEVLGGGRNGVEAMHKAFLASGIDPNRKGKVMILAPSTEEAEMIGLVKDLEARSYSIMGNHAWSDQVTVLNSLEEILSALKQEEFAYLLLSHISSFLDASSCQELYRLALTHQKAVFTSVDTLRALLIAQKVKETSVRALQDVE